MKRLALLAALLFFAPQARAGDGFLSGISDLPLMPGLAEDVDSAMVFDTPEGRIAHFQAFGKVQAIDVLGFYAETLPQLGWTLAGKDRYKREKEQLRLIVKQAPKGQADVRFEIAPLKSK